MNTSGLPDSIMTPQSWSKAQLEQFSLLMAAASQMSVTSLPQTMPGMPCNTFLGNAFPISASNSAPGIDLNRTPQFPLHNVDNRSSGSSILNPNLVNLPTPDGKSAMRYPEPDVKSLVFDPTVGYRFDPSTGLHYDANSGLFVNKNLGILLKYEKLTNTYERAGTTSDIVAPVLARELAELLGYDETPQTNLNPETHQDVSAEKFRDESSRVQKRSAGYKEMSPVQSPTSRRDQSRSPYRDEGDRYNSNTSPLNPTWDDVSSRRSKRDRGKSRSSSSLESDVSYKGDDMRIKRKRDRSKGDQRNNRSSDEDESYPPTQRKRSRPRSPPRRSRGQLDKSRSKSKELERNEGTMTQPDAFDAIAQIHERNLKTPGNISGRFFPSTYKDCSQLCSIMVTPLPPKGDREWKDLEILMAGITRANGFRVESVKVCPKDGNTPFDQCFIRFRESQDARRWYLLHDGELEFANPDGSKFKSFLYLTDEYWECLKCKKSNFPLRSFCYGCIRHRTKLLRPIYESVFDTNWVGILKLDCRIASVEDVLEFLPPLDSYDIKSCELITETNGLCLGLCVFKTTNKTKAKDFLDFLVASNFDAVFLTISSRIGLSYNPRSLSSGSNECNPQSNLQSQNPANRRRFGQRPDTAVMIRHSSTQTFLSNVKDLGDYILRNMPVDLPSPNTKGTQTVLINKFL